MPALDEFGFSAEEQAVIDERLAQLIVDIESSGLEGTSYPVVLHIAATKDEQELIAASNDASPSSLRELRSRRNSDLREILNKNQATLRRDFLLTDALSTSVGIQQLQDILRTSKGGVLRVESDTPGALELDVARGSVQFVNTFDGVSLDGAGQIIAVLDGEIPSHPALDGRVEQKSVHAKFGWGERDDHAAEIFARTHALSVASIIAGDGKSSSDETQFKGLCPAAKIWNYKIAPSSPTGSDVVKALEAAFIDGAKIINLSWGKKDVAIDAESLWSRTVDELFKRGVLVIKSAGNTGPSSRSISAPADAKFVISVGATDREGLAMHEGSSIGPTADGRPKPDVLAPGGGIIAAAPNGHYAATSAPGTSFAAPVVAAMAALLWQCRPNATAQQIRTAILKGCVPLPPSRNTSSEELKFVSLSRSLDILRDSTA